MSIYMGPNEAYPRYAGDIKIDYPDWDESMDLPVGWMLVKEITPPAVSPENFLVELGPHYDGKDWVQQWMGKPITPEIQKKNDELISALKNKKASV